MDFKERRFSIDPGNGKKMDGCPYSIYEDGRDVKDYMIPPKGHVFKGFRFDPDASNQIYDGKLIAEYEKEPFNAILKSNLWKFLLALAIIAVITIVVLLAVNVFNNPSPNKPVKPQKPTVAATDTTQKAVQPESNDATLTSDTTKQADETAVIVDSDEKQQEGMAETPQPVADDPNILFKQAFWTLIHQRTIMMDPYDALFKEYKGKAEGEEYDYLRFTILKDYSSFKAWYTKLHKVPVAELETINTINDLKNKINEIQP